MSVESNFGHIVQICPSLLDPEQTDGKSLKVYPLHDPRFVSLTRIHAKEVLAVRPALGEPIQTDLMRFCLCGYNVL